MLLSQSGKPGEGLASFQAARAIQQRLADANPAVTQFQSDLATSHHSIGILLSQRPASRARRWRRTRRRGRSSRGWPTPTPPSPSSSKTGE